MDRIKKIQNDIIGVDTEAIKECKKILDSRMKPEKSLGVLEDLAMKVAGITGQPLNELKAGCHFIASSDNGVIEEGVSSCPIEYTRIVSEAMLSSFAAIGILCKSLGIPLNLIDIGIKGDIPRNYENLYVKKIAYGTKNFSKEPAMSLDEVIKAILVGVEIIKEKKEYDFFSNGEMGIANTTTSSAILYALTKEDIEKVVGCGAGLSDEGLRRKKDVIKDACLKYDLFNKEPIEVLRCVGGLDIACMVGLYLGAALERKPMLIDGFISAVAALVATRIEPKVKNYLIGTHMSEEPGMKVVMTALDLKTFLHMEMRLGEGTGAVLAYPILKAAVEIPKIMKTKDEVYEIFQ
ncbi:MAG: nicotinate-nucleotide--dimethylbenzimidazole phosphoribosyltransferase [Cetobacterium somerae]|mgnify:CR=1 FL=1|uniref:Nicotinate-nucleotide--dimethylbenzimidazole phosphoribosyltransferase n=1 Tax=Cetobacterium somerae ATCC BAA-474 TaxID=1319815 RepID=U7VAC2_9FUSO|nr:MULTISPECIES: nicotinate-nucleotide--dimethylbenzimidazole phosphoribosyltransferase [Cetobacterium]ERT68094.1 nicotinate-nucleotide--dimethylbenzimidazole phosphoribosyltransferase [Cetobacterium somerae ATCC BAA-474]MCQ8211600.1 nicotinate-nucleotide--dimethylbenzimidazole phosphoribosyltransferase [Cetobacterium sp. NK01]